MRERVALVTATRRWLADELHQLQKCGGISAVYPSESNYLLVRFPPGSPAFKSLWDQGIILRNQNKQPGLADCLRITIGTRDECQRVVSALRELSLTQIPRQEAM